MALSLDGSTQYAYNDGSHAFFATDTDWTVDFWWYNTYVDVSYPATEGQYWNDTGSGGYEMCDRQNYGYRQFYEGGSQGWIMSERKTWTTNTWYHIELGKDVSAKKMYCFVNGAVLTSTPDPAEATQTAGTKFYLGTGVSGKVKGYYAEMRISNTLRHTSTFTPATAAYSVDGNTVALYHLVSDGVDSSNGWDLTLSGSPGYVSDSPFAGTGTNTQINIGDAWKAITGYQINIGDTWKSVTKIQQNIGDAWKSVF
jgi:hypothetical protein